MAGVGSTTDASVGQVSRTPQASTTAAAPTTATGLVRDQANQALGEHAPPPAAVPVATPPSPAAAPTSDMEGHLKERADAVAANPGHRAVTDFNTLGDREARKTFVSNITQLGGGRGDLDGQMCGPTALVAGITMGDPKATQKLAGGILDQSYSEHNKMFSEPLGKDNVEALKRIRDGNASPADVARLAAVMSTSRGVNIGTNGASVDEMGAMLSNARSFLKDDMPNMSLHMYADANSKDAGSHWQVGSSGVEIDPWPNAKGQSPMTEGAAGLGQGASHYPQGTVHTKILVEDHGNRLTIPRYLGVDAQGNRIKNDDVNQPLTHYVYDSNWLGWGYSRSSGEMPPGVKPDSEPAGEIGR